MRRATIKRPWVILAAAAVLLWAAISAVSSHAQHAIDADVIVLDDTSASMQQNDPQNAIVLVTRLFADISPGKLGAVRLLDIGRDGSAVHAQATGQQQPCPDDPSRTCQVMKTADDAMDRVVREHLLIQNRSSRGDAAFKASLIDLLRPSAMDTQYQYSLATIEKQFQLNGSLQDAQKLVVWLSDGDVKDADWSTVKPFLDRLRGNGVLVRALVFKSGKTERMDQAGIKTDRVNGSASDLMRAFASVFRQVVGAPYAVDGAVASQPGFKMMRRIDEAWVVIYGDSTLNGASVSNGSQTVNADYAADSYNGAAYRVVHLTNPADGNWTVRADGGGAGVSYAVIQHSALTPYLYPVSGQVPGIPFRVVVSMRLGKDGADLPPSDLPEAVTIEANLDGHSITLHDDGQNGDEAAGDGRYSGMLTATRDGSFTLSAHAHNSFLDRTVTAQVQVTGKFEYNGGPVLVDFGSFKAGQTVCRPLILNATQLGGVHFTLQQVGSLPPNLRLELRVNGKAIDASKEVPLALPQDQKELCITAGRYADASVSQQQNWANLLANGGQSAGSTVVLNMSWTVQPLSFWEKWGWLILIILGLLLLWFVIYGYIKPYRFVSTLALCFAVDIEDLDDQTPIPIKVWRGVGIGFYRNARACLRDSFKIDGNPKGAVAILEAGPRRSVWVKPGARSLYRDVGVDEWELVQPRGQRAGQGELYRVGESGPYFRISIRTSA